MSLIAATEPSGLVHSAAYITIAATAISALMLLALHFVNPQARLSWHMVSEYANGNYPWLLMIVFVAWGVASWSLVIALGPLWLTWLGRVGLVFLILAGVGQVMGGIFDVNHKLHGMAFAIGVPSLTIAAILVTLAMRQSGADMPMWPAHLSWISFVAMAIAMFTFMSSLSRAGVDWSDPKFKLTELPPGVTAWNGWANRLLFAASYLWLIMAARAA